MSMTRPLLVRIKISLTTAGVLARLDSGTVSKISLGTTRLLEGSLRRSKRKKIFLKSSIVQGSGFQPCDRRHLPRTGFDEKELYIEILFAFNAVQEKQRITIESYRTFSYIDIPCNKDDVFGVTKGSDLCPCTDPIISRNLTFTVFLDGSRRSYTHLGYGRDEDELGEGRILCSLDQSERKTDNVHLRVSPGPLYREERPLFGSLIIRSDKGKPSLTSAIDVW
ncbi:uncharacterized protein BT62DRAFT_1010442 [Guyanagaster necrorhizus]|uniref:Uncharacterized protein n=1 Tax=Guyanagaster necrorhizus TaxID=856835 RepID=A0A9P7VL01_9AGAR|nr:uncharacterized protein BT62DRAFT_1010442 [Guyanagaster necrorhizus MCA 3950]KAG7442480.1 hypothetical protein BT62DRAFT_1010442 [Guyanagaster necrorhizus MCA 3950]